MFKSWSKTRDMITLFHKPSSQQSVRVLNMLKQASATASETATEDQASDHSSQNQAQRSEFDIEIVETLPTKDQLQSILEYVGDKSIGTIIKGATGKADAMKKFGQDSESFHRPVVVDWNKGQVASGETESQIIKMLGQANLGKQS